MSDAKIGAVLCVEASFIDEIEATTDDVAGGVFRTVFQATVCSSWIIVVRRVERMAIVSMIAVGVLAPSYTF